MAIFLNYSFYSLGTAIIRVITMSSNFIECRWALPAKLLSVNKECPNKGM